MNRQTDNNHTSICIFFSDNKEYADYLIAEHFVQEVFLITSGNRGELENTIKRAASLFFYVDIVHTNEETNKSIIDTFVYLWNNGLKEKKDNSFILLRTNGFSTVTKKLAGLDAGASIYLFSLNKNYNIQIEGATTPLQEISLNNIRTVLQRPNIGNQDLPDEYQKEVIQNIKFYYERKKDFDWKVEGTLMRGAPPSEEIEKRSVIVSACIIYKLFPTSDANKYYISVEIKGSGYKMNIIPRDRVENKKNNPHNLVLHPGSDHTGYAFTGNLLRKYTVECELESPSNEKSIVELLPDNDIKTTDVSVSKSHGCSVTVQKTKKKGSGGGSATYNYNWESRVSYSQADFELYTIQSEYDKKIKAIWETRPCMWFRQKAFVDGDTRKELNVEHITQSFIKAGDTDNKGRERSAYLDLQSPDFPRGFHSMSPEASALFLIKENDSKTKVTTTFKLEIQDSRSKWIAGTRRNEKHKFNIRTFQHLCELLPFINDEDVIFD